MKKYINKMMLVLNRFVNFKVPELYQLICCISDTGLQYVVYNCVKGIILNDLVFIISAMRLFLWIWKKLGLGCLHLLTFIRVHSSGSAFQLLSVQMMLLDLFPTLLSSLSSVWQQTSHLLAATGSFMSSSLTSLLLSTSSGWFFHTLPFGLCFS